MSPRFVYFFEVTWATLWLKLRILKGCLEEEEEDSHVEDENDSSYNSDDNWEPPWDPQPGSNFIKIRKCLYSISIKKISVLPFSAFAVDFDFCCLVSHF